MKKMIWLLLAVTLLMLTLFLGCVGITNTVEHCIVSNEQYCDKDTLENAVQSDTLSAGQEIYANVYFIESPLGMEYVGKWYLGGNEIKKETKEMVTDKSGIIVFTLDAEYANVGLLRFEILYNEDVLFSYELPVQ